MVGKVCWRCIGDELVSAAIKVEQPRRVCSYCGSRRSSIAVSALASFVDPVFQASVGHAEDGFAMRGGEPWFGPLGELPSDLMNQMLMVDDENIGRDLVRILARRHGHAGHDGGFDYYDDTSDTYTIVSQGEGWHRRDWEEFCRELKHHRRFFLNAGPMLLDELFGPILRGEWPAGGAIREIGPGSEQRHIFRGRLANNTEAQQEIYRKRRNRLSAPRPGVAGAGRMNAAGISVFYGSFDLDTCIAELRTPVGGYALVGKFEILRPLRVLDLTMLDGSLESLSYFDPNYSQQMSYQGFMQTFHEEVRKAVLPGSETLEYLPTQLVAEYLWTRDEPIDGLIFGSAQISDTHNNIVLFPHACVVEGAEEEMEYQVARVYHHAAMDEYDGEEYDVVSLESVPEVEREPAVALPDFGGGILFDLPADIEPVQPELANLRLSDDSIWRVKVTGISYNTRPVPTRFEKFDDGL